MKRTQTVKVQHRRFGTVKVKIDVEDVPLLEGYHLQIKNWDCVDRHSLVIVRPVDSPNEYYHLSRHILAAHNALDYGENVFYKDGNSFNLCKKNLSPGTRKAY